MAFVTLPIDTSGKLIPWSDAAIALMDIKRRGVNGTTQDHVKYNFGPEGSGCTRRFSCDWSQRFNAQMYFVGCAAVWFDSGNAKLSRLIPQKDPNYSRWICTKCEIGPFRFMASQDPPALGSEAYPQFERAELTCTYELVPFSVLDDGSTEGEQQRYVTLPGFPGADISTEANYIGLTGSVLKYTNSTSDPPKGVSIPFPVGFVEPGRKFSAIWRRLPRGAWGPGTTLFNRVIGLDGSRSWLGAINSTVFLDRWEATIQLIGVEEKLLPDATGLDYSWDLRYIFSDKPVPYGHLGFYYHSLGAGAAGYYQALRPPAVGGGPIDPAALNDTDAMFIARDLNMLFVPGTS